MNIIKRAYDRLTGVLGYDYQGKPLRKGDLVEPAPGSRPSLIAQCQMTILRAANETDGMENGKRPVVVLINPEKVEICCTRYSALAKSNNTEGDSSWEEVEQATGWKPTEQEREVAHG